MKLKTKIVNWRMKELSQVKELILHSFPENERYPIWLLQLMTMHRDVEFRAFFDGSDLCGVLYTASGNKIIYTLYLAVNERFQSKGYGSAILSWLKKQNPQKDIALSVEQLDETAENNLQRIKRIEFYNRNGFHMTEYFLQAKSDIYAIMATTMKFSPEEFLNARKKMIAGCGNINIHCSCGSLNQ